MKRSSWFYSLVASLTLGLAPFVPEPHVWKQLSALVNGTGIHTAMDWFDLVLHGAPWVWLIFESYKLILAKKQKIE